MTDRFPDSEPPEEVETFRADLAYPRPRRRSRVWGWVRGILILVAVLALIGGGGAMWVKLAYLSDLPSPPSADALWTLNQAPGIIFLDRAGALIAQRGPRHGYRVRLADLPPYVPQAFLAAEDRRFYRHGAIDWTGVARAAIANLRAGQVVQGGSTLTQQLAKSLFLKPDQTLKRKVQEAVLAYRLGRMMSRDQILELYLNRVFFGAQAYGVDAAARAYFGKPAGQLTLSEAALLAALPKAPSRLSPAADMPGAVARSRLVLRRMVEEGWITPAQEQAAVAAPPVLAPEPPEDEDFGYVLDLAQAQAARLAGDKAPDLVVRLSIDSGLQTTATEIVRRVVETDGRRAGATEGALVALAPDGAISAMVGGLDHRYSLFNRAVQAQRQPGSAFKPFIYAAALEAGVKPTDIREDAPVRLGPWSPKNYGGGYRGPVTVDEALVRSINTVAVRLAREAGSQRIGDLAYRFGLASIPTHPGLSVALGAYETNLLELTSGYQVFQQGGRRVNPYLIEMITDSAGKVLYAQPDAAPRQVYDPGRNAEMVRMLRGVIQRGTGVHAGFGRPAAGKTGTSQSWRDAWFVGFTPDWVCGVWVGDDAGRPMDRVAGGDLPAQIWRRFMLAAHQGLPVRDFTGQAPAPPPPAPAESDAADAAASPDAEAPAEPQQPSAGARGAFYQGLADDFAAAEGPPR